MNKPPVQQPRKEEQTTTALRLPKSLHEELKRAADENFRSLNDEMVSRLDTTLLKEITRQNDELKMMLREVLTHLRR